MYMDENLGLGRKDMKETFVQYNLLLYNIIFFYLVHILVKQSGIQGLLAMTLLFLLPCILPLFPFWHLLRGSVEHSLRSIDPASALVVLS